uniref:t-SNARE coiled-coil homology domain-containing protein n=1 Tax=Theileria annulata TaxID=5874 RepID=A0A3B0N205_THEAN
MPLSEVKNSKIWTVDPVFQNGEFEDYKAESEMESVVESDQIQGSTSNVIREYTDRIIKSIKESLSFCVNTENIANISLLDLCVQNEQINRIKVDLNKFHENVSLSERLVEKYVSTIGWICSSVKWSNGVKLDVEESDEKLNELAKSFSDSHPFEESNIDTDFRDLPPTNEPVNDFFSTATRGLSSLVNNMKKNKAKTDLLSSVIMHQNNELEKINSSAQNLRDRVSSMNSLLKS